MLIVVPAVVELLSIIFSYRDSQTCIYMLCVRACVREDAHFDDTSLLPLISMACFSYSLDICS